MIVAVVLCAVAGLVLGIVNGVLVTVCGLPSVVATLGTLYAYRGIVALQTAGAKLGRLTSFLSSSRRSAPASPWASRAWPGSHSGVVLAGAYVLRYTGLGRDFYAVGSSPTQLG